MERYATQMTMLQIGEEGQKKLRNSRVLVVGAGGLGSPVLYYLTAVGIGTIGIVDDDEVSITNLNRQILYTEEDIGTLKACTAYKRLSALNHHTNIEISIRRLTENGIESLFDRYDVIIDCVDNNKTRHLVSRYGLALNKTVIESGIDGCKGYVFTIKRGEACYGCFYPLDTDGGEKRPVLAPTAGAAGCFEVMECVKVLLGIGQPLYSRILYYDLLTMDFKIRPLKRMRCCPDCAGLDI